jgi:hypothetical protein
MTAKLQSLEKLLEDKLKKIEVKLNGKLKCTIYTAVYIRDVSHWELFIPSHKLALNIDIEI